MRVWVRVLVRVMVVVAVWTGNSILRLRPGGCVVEGTSMEMGRVCRQRLRVMVVIHRHRLSIDWTVVARGRLVDGVIVAHIRVRCTALIGTIGIL
jgi:hypothetical protein